MESNQIEGQEGWKDSYTLKEFKQNKDSIMKLSLMMPKVFEQTTHTETIPGWELINMGIEYMGNEKVNPCKDYFQQYIKHTYVNHFNKLKRVFMDSGMPGVQQYIAKAQIYLENQLKKYPEMYVTN